METFTPLPVEQSLVAPAALPSLLEAHYDLSGPISCRLKHVGDNDTYIVDAGGTSYVLRIYRWGRYWMGSEEDYRFELAWLDFLRQRGVAVSCAVARRDGDVLGVLQAPEGQRYWVLFDYAPGEGVFPLSCQQARLYGQKEAEIHLVTNDFKCEYQRYHLDLDFLLDQPVEHIAALWGESRKEDVQFLSSLTAELRQRITGLGIDGDGYGVISGDFHGGNNHFADNGEITFFDFDMCGWGWRAYDLAVFYRNAQLNGTPQAVGQALLDGYQSVRPLTPSERTALPLFVMARTIHRMGARVWETRFKGESQLEFGYWEMMMAALRKWDGEDDFWVERG